MPWSAEKKTTIEKAIGNVELASSDESDLSEDENVKTRVKKVFLKKSCHGRGRHYQMLRKP